MSTLEDPSARGPRIGRSVGVAMLTSVVVAFWVLRDSWGPGQYLVRDFIAVPVPARPPLLPTAAADLRAWPLDGLAWLFSGVVGTGHQQLLLLAGCLLLAGTGAGLLVHRHGTAAVVAAGVVAVWNPYVTERLLLGQPPTLLGYASLPWVVLAVRSRWPLGRRMALLVLAAMPAALTPWGGVTAMATAVAAALWYGRRRREVALVVLVGVGWCLPWMVPALLAGGAPADPDGARAFALADDTGLGTWLSALQGSGVWAEGARPLSRNDPLARAASLALVVLGVVGALALNATDLRGRPARVVAALAALLAPAGVLAVASGPALGLATAAQGVPGLALLRDQHRLLAPAVLATAVLVGVVVGHVARLEGRLAGGGAAALVLALCVTSVPDLHRTVGAAYQPVVYPSDWARMVAAADRTAGGGAVLSLPAQPLRRPTWAPREAFLDPLPLALSAPVLRSSALSVRRGGSVLRVDDGTTSDELAWERGVIDAEGLRRNGVRVVVEALGTPGLSPTNRNGWREVFGAEHFRVWDVTDAR